MIWGFAPEGPETWETSPFVAAHIGTKTNGAERDAAMQEFWACWDQLHNFGLFEFVGHLVHADTDEGEIIHPLALHGMGLEIEQELGRLSDLAGLAMITEGQEGVAKRKGVEILAPVRRHIEGVQMVGIARLRYRPRTNRTLAFMAREADWNDALGLLRAIVNQADALATSR